MTKEGHGNDKGNTGMNDKGNKGMIETRNSVRKTSAHFGAQGFKNGLLFILL
jgi:hypothetical protein